MLCDDLRNFTGSGSGEPLGKPNYKRNDLIPKHATIKQNQNIPELDKLTCLPQHQKKLLNQKDTPKEKNNNNNNNNNNKNNNKGHNQNILLTEG